MDKFINRSENITNSNIAIKDVDGKIRSIPCYLDGYPEWTGKILCEFYDTQEKVNDLLEMGSVRFLNKNIISSEFYHRDFSQNKNETKAKVYVSDKDWFNSKPQSEFNYLFENGEWFLITGFKENPMKTTLKNYF